MKFRYKAVTKEGKLVQGIIEAKEASEVAVYLRNHEFLPIVITKKEERDFSKFLPFLSKFRSSDLIFFTRQLASMLVAGITLMDALRILQEQTQKQAMHEIIHSIILDVEGGKSFSAAIGKYPDVFFSIYVSLIKSAESAGLLDKTLLRLAENLEKEQKIKSTVKSALLYPAIVIIGMGIVVIIMMLFVIPQLSTVYESLQIQLPLSTRIIINMSNLFIHYWVFLIGSMGIFLFLFHRWHKTESGKLIFDDFLLHLPVFGKLIRQTILAEFARTFGLLVGAGTLIVEALNQTSDIAGNTIYKNAIVGVAQQVEKGIAVGDSLSGYSVFPPILVQMAKIGEQTGKLDESLLRASEYFEREVEQATKTLTTAMEPIIMVVLGMGVAFLIISIITPIYSLTSSIK